MSTTGPASWNSNGSEDGKLDAPDSAGEIEDTSAFAEALAKNGRPNLAPLDPRILAHIDPLIAGDNRQVSDALLNMCQDDTVNGGWIAWLSSKVRQFVNEMKDDLLLPLIQAGALSDERVAKLADDLKSVQTMLSTFNPNDIVTELTNLRNENNDLRAKVEAAQKTVKTMTELHKDAYTGMVQIYNEFRDSNKVTSNDERDRLLEEVKRLTLQLSKTTTTTTPTVQIPSTASTSSHSLIRVDNRPAITWMDLRTKFRPQLTPAEAMQMFRDGTR
jgi:hypothetical protein